MVHEERPNLVIPSMAAAAAPLPPRASCGVMPVSIFRHPRVWYLYLRLGEAADEFLFAVKHESERAKCSHATLASRLRETLPGWNPVAIAQRTTRLKELARDVDDALQTAFTVFVKDTYAEDLRERKRKVRVRLPRLGDFVHMFFVRLVTTPEVQRGTYFDTSTVFRNHAVSNAMISALADACVDNVQVVNAAPTAMPTSADRVPVAAPARSTSEDDMIASLLGTTTPDPAPDVVAHPPPPAMLTTSRFKTVEAAAIPTPGAAPPPAGVAAPPAPDAKPQQRPLTVNTVGSEDGRSVARGPEADDSGDDDATEDNDDASRRGALALLQKLRLT